MIRYRWQLLALFILTMMDIGLTVTGFATGATEMNPLFGRIGTDVFQFRMISFTVFVILYALLADKYPWATSRALYIVLVIMVFAVAWNMVAIADGAIYG